jgi:hypothetical protein
MHAQNPLFVRVYGLSGKKINRGRVVAATDSTLLLSWASHVDTISVRHIGAIRTKHNAGNNIGYGMALGAVTGLIIAASYSNNHATNPDGTPVMLHETEKAVDVLGGILLGGAAGAGIGAITSSFKNSKHYLIHGDLMKWKAFQSVITAYNAKRQKNTNDPVF